MSAVIDPTTGVDLATDAVARALAAGAHEAEVSHNFSEKFEVNYDGTDVTLIRSGVVDGLSIKVYVDTCVGSSTLTGRSPDQVQAAVEAAVAAARAGAPDPANGVADGPGDAFVDRGDAEPDHEHMVDTVMAHVEALKADHPKIVLDVSQYEFDNSFDSYANSAGRVQHARTGSYAAVMMCTGRDEGVSTSFDYAVHQSPTPFDSLTDLPAIRQLIHETEASFGARPVPTTFEGDVIFTPAAVETLVGTVAGALGGMALVQQTTPYADKLGEQIAATGFSVLHRPDELWASATFDGSGVANRELDVIVDGVLQNFHIGWYASRKLGREMTVGPQNHVVPPGDESLADIIARTERGIVLGRYSGGMPNPALDFSGVAKNSFYVEDGEVRFPLNETMIAGNFCRVLEAISAVSAEVLDTGTSRMPWIRAGGVTISRG